MDNECERFNIHFEDNVMCGGGMARPSIQWVRSTIYSIPSLQNSDSNLSRAYLFLYNIMLRHRELPIWPKPFRYGTDDTGSLHNPVFVHLFVFIMKTCLKPTG